MFVFESPALHEEAALLQINHFPSPSVHIETHVLPTMPTGARTSKAAKRASLLAVGNDADDDELRSMGEAPSTTRSKASRVALFKDWLKSRGTPFPVRPEQVQMFAAQLTIWEYRHVSDYTGSVMQWLCEPPLSGEAPRLTDGPGLLRNLADTERSIIRTITNGEPTKAPPIRVGTAWARLTPKDACIASLWSLTGLRLDSLAAIGDVDVKITPACIQILVRQDKIKNQEGRLQHIYCNCTAEHLEVFCPLHCDTPVDSRWFPLGRANCGKIAKLLGGRAHSFRRSCALSLRRAADVTGMRSAAVAHHMGWEHSAAMWDEYTFDYNALWKEEAHAFVPVAGLLPALALKGPGAKPHVFKQRPEKVLVKRTFPISSNQALRKGKTALASSIKSVSRWELKDAPASDTSVPSTSSSTPAWAGRLRF